MAIKDITDSVINHANESGRSPLFLRLMLNVNGIDRALTAVSSVPGVALFKPMFISFFISQIVDNVGQFACSFYEVVNHAPVKEVVDNFIAFVVNSKPVYQDADERIDLLLYSALLASSLVIQGFLSYSAHSVPDPKTAIQKLKGSKSAGFDKYVENTSQRKGDPNVLLDNLAEISRFNGQCRGQERIIRSDLDDGLGIRRTRSMKFSRILIRVKDMNLRGKMSIWEYFTCNFFRLQPRSKFICAPSIEKLIEKYSFGDSSHDDDIRLWDMYANQAKVAASDILNDPGELERRWEDGSIPHGVTGYDAKTSKELYDMYINGDILFTDTPETCSYMKIWKSATKPRQIWAFPLLVIICQLCLTTESTSNSVRIERERAASRTSWHMIQCANGLPKQDWGKKLITMNKFVDLDNWFVTDVSPLHNRSKENSGILCVAQGDAKGYDQHWWTWEIMIVSIAIYSCSNFQVTQFSPVFVLSITLYQAWTPVILRDEGLFITNGVMASGDGNTLILNDITNWIHVEYCYIVITNGIISCFYGHAFFNGDNFEHIVGAFIGNSKQRVLLYNYNMFVDIYSIFGHELHDVNELILQKFPFGMVEFSSFFFRVPEHADRLRCPIYFPYRELEHIASSCCCSERYENIRTYSETYSATAIHAALSQAYDLYRGNTYIYNTILRRDPIFWKMINDSAKLYIPLNKVSYDVYDVTGQSIQVTGSLVNSIEGFVGTSFGQYLNLKSDFGMPIQTLRFEGQHYSVRDDNRFKVGSEMTIVKLSDPNTDAISQSSERSISNKSFQSANVFSLSEPSVHLRFGELMQEFLPCYKGRISISSVVKRLKDEADLSSAYEISSDDRVQKLFYDTVYQNELQRKCDVIRPLPKGIYPFRNIEFSN